MAPSCGLRLGRDLVDLAVHLRVGQRADLDARGHPLVQLAHVDLVHRALEDELSHVGQGREGGAGLVRGERHHGVAFVHEQLEHRARRGRADDRLDVEVLALHAALLDEGQLLGGELQPDLGVLDLLVGDVRLLAGDDALRAQATPRGRTSSGLLVDVLRDLHLAARLGELERRRVGQDLEERVAGLHAVAHLAEGLLHDAGDLALHRDLALRPDRADRQGLLHDGPAATATVLMPCPCSRWLAVEGRRQPCGDHDHSRRRRSPSASGLLWLANTYETRRGGWFRKRGRELLPGHLVLVDVASFRCHGDIHRPGTDPPSRRRRRTRWAPAGAGPPPAGEAPRARPRARPFTWWPRTSP